MELKIGDKINQLTYVGETEEYKVYRNNEKRKFHLWDCDCGKKGVRIIKNNVTSGGTKSCGCSQHNGKNLCGVYDKITLLEKTELKTNYSRSIYKALCDCGNIFNMDGSAVKSGKVKSCGCAKIKAIKEHYEFVPHLHKNQDKFIKGQKLDQIKEDWCRDNNVPLLIIPYHKIKEVNTLIEEFLNDNN